MKRGVYKHFFFLFSIALPFLFICQLAFAGNGAFPNAVAIDKAFSSRAHEVWLTYKKLMKNKKYEEGARQLDILHLEQRALGIKDLPPYSHALVREAQRQEDPEQAKEIFYYARKLSPDLPSIDFREAIYMIKNGVLDIVWLSKFTGGGIIKLWTNYSVRFSLIANFLFYLSGAFVFAVLLSLLMMALKYFRPLSHDTGDALKINTNLFKTFLCGCLFLVPLFMPVGLLGVIIIWSFLICAYLSRQERFLLTALIIGFLLAPTLMGAFIGLCQYEKSIEGHMMKVLDGQCLGPCIYELKDYEEANPEDLDVTFSLGYILKKRGYYSLAARHYEKILGDKGGFKDLLVKSYNNLANIYWSLGDYEKAIKYYELATKRDPKNAIAYYNLSQAFYATAQLEEGTAALNRAEALEPKIIEKFKTQELDPSRLDLVDLGLIPFSIYKRWFKPKNYYKNEIFSELWSSVIPFSGPSGAFLLIAFFISWALFSALFLVKRNLCSKLCLQCGHVVCHRCGYSPKKEQICSECFNLLRFGSGRVSPERKRQKELNIKKYKERQSKIAILLSVPFAGLGHIYDNKPIKGFLLLGLVGLMIFSMLSSSPPITTVDQLPKINFWVATVFEAIILILAIVYAVKDIRKQNA